MTFSWCSTFPQCIFKEFETLSKSLFSPALSDEDIEDPNQKRLQFQSALQAVRFRHLACSEQNREFKILLTEAMENDLYRVWSIGCEHHYRIEQCLYTFFMNAQSVFESLGFCLYFVGAAVEPKSFPYTGKPRKITLQNICAAFQDSFPSTSITQCLMNLRKEQGFINIDSKRNVLAHRLVGQRNIRSSVTINLDESVTETREELWYIPGLEEEVLFEKDLLQLHFDDLNELLAPLAVASLEFVKSVKKIRSIAS